MTTEQATQRLLFHAQPLSGSFLDMLRPFRGIRQDVLDDILQALYAAAPIIQQPEVPRELISAIWAIGFYAQAWGIDPDSMIQRNRLMSARDTKTLLAFVKKYNFQVMMLLDGSAPADLPADGVP